MRRHELELITALAEGTLDDETEARALIESSEPLRAEYESQRSAIQALRGLPTPKLTEGERASLRRDVWADLRSRPSTSRSSSAWYLRWAGAAAALVVVAGTVAVLNQQASTDLAASTDPAAEAAPPSGQDDGEAAYERVEDAALATSDGLAGTEVPSAGASPVDTSELADVAARLREQETVYAYRASDEGVANEEEHLGCLESLGLEDHQALGEFQAQDGRLYIVAVPEQPLRPETPISFIDATACEMMFTD